MWGDTAKRSSARTGMLKQPHQGACTFPQDSQRGRRLPQPPKRGSAQVMLKGWWRSFAMGAVVFKHTCKLGFEDIISKRRDAPYRSGRAEDWIKIKCVRRARYSVVGFVPETASIAALYLGRHDGGTLVYAGKVGTGFTRKTANAVRRKLDEIIVARSPLTVPIRKPKAKWVEPKLWAEDD